MNIEEKEKELLALGAPTLARVASRCSKIEMLEELLRVAGHLEEVKLAIARNKLCSAEMLELFSFETSYLLQWVVGWHENTKRSAIERLCTHGVTVQIRQNAFARLEEMGGLV